MRKNLAVIAAIIFVVGAVAAQTPRRRAAASRTHHTTARHSLSNPASLKDQAPDVYKAKFTTTKGDFVVQVTRAWAPLGADRFYNLVKYGYFTDASFFRVLPGFVVQFGLSAKPAINAAWSHAAIKDDSVTQSNKRGYVTFATAGQDTRTTQVFIDLGDNERLDADGFAPFGQVVEGMDVVDKLYSGYGEGAPQGTGPDQSRIESEGKTYLEQNFPQLDSIKSALIVGAPAPAQHAPAHRAAAKKPS